MHATQIQSWKQTKKTEKKESKKKKKKKEREDSSCDQQQIIQKYEHRLAQQRDNGTRRTLLVLCIPAVSVLSFNLKGTLAPLIPALKLKGIQKHPVEQITGCKQQSEGQDMNMICRESNKCSTDSHS